MIGIRRAAFVAFFVGILHLVFGGIVRVTGSGMGCGTHWPTCHGYWFPPMNRMDLVIEVLHRYLALVLFIALAVAAFTAWRHRALPGVAGRGGPLRSATAATLFWFAPALLGAVTVWVGNTPYWTVAHWMVAATLLAIATATVVRSGGLGGAPAQLGGGSKRMARAALAAAGIALLALALGGLTAKLPGANVACTGFPHCGPSLVDAGGGKHVQLTHRVLAFLLWFHLIGMVIASRRRAEHPAVRRAAYAALAAVTIQLGVAAAMVLLRLPPVLRSLHQATGVAVWVTVVVFAYLAHIAAGSSAVMMAPASLPPEPEADGEPDAVAT